mgnify:CR=1 FL=1
MKKLKGKPGKQRNKASAVVEESNGKIDVEKASWSWIENLNEPLDKDEISDEHIQSAYRLNFPQHIPEAKATTACKKNCKQNPLCYAQIGREKWLRASSEIRNSVNNSDSQESDDEEDDGTEFEKRPTFVGNDGQTLLLPVGLKNLVNAKVIKIAQTILFNLSFFSFSVSFSFVTSSISVSSTFFP